MEPHAPSDAELVAKTLSGDREPFGELYDRHARRVRAVVAGVSGDWPGIEDMTQECFLRAYRSLRSLRDPQQFGPWLSGFARRVARERRRSLARDRHEFSRDLARHASAGDVDHDVGEREQLANVLQRLAELPESERMAIHAYYFEDQDAQHAAEIIGVSRSGFYALVTRAIARLAATNKTPATKSRN